jgi:hypothetical protein
VIGQIAELVYNGTQFQLISVQPSMSYYGLDTSVAANTVTVNITPPLLSYTTGTPRFYVKIANTNTGATNINANGLGNKSVVLGNGGALIGSELQAGMIAEFVYDGTNVQLLTPASQVSRSSGGYVKIPGGITVQGGISASLGSLGTTPVVFAIPFSSAVGSICATPNAASGNLAAVSVDNVTTSGFTMNNATTNTYSAYWMAVGF